jgi:hypothetical protein
MKRLLLVLAACGKHAAAPPPPEAAPVVARDAAIDALACPGKPEDCSACLSGSGAACFAVAIETHPDSATGAWYQRGCDLDDLDSCQGLSWFATFYGTHEDFVRATDRQHALEAKRLAAARAKCDAHDEKACQEAGVWLALGTGAPKDQAAAIALLDASCGRGNLEGCEAIVVVAEDAATRERYARRACHEGRADSCGELLGLWGAPNAPHAPAFARAELTRLCKAKHADACGVLEEARHPTKVPGMDDAKLDLGPLINATKSGKPPRR